jgi:NADH-quinone oxidoreductase subunit E
MFYLFIQTWAWILLAFVLGIIIGWWLHAKAKANEKHTCEVCEANARAAKLSPSVAAVVPEPEPVVEVVAEPEPIVETPEPFVAEVPDAPEVPEVDDSPKPLGFAVPPEQVDQLKRIKGIGPVIEKTLNSLGIYQFKQIAEFTRENITWVEEHLSFIGRIDREDWVAQAKALHEGQETEFSKRVDEGKLDY